MLHGYCTRIPNSPNSTSFFRPLREYRFPLLLVVVLWCLPGTARAQQADLSLEKTARLEENDTRPLAYPFVAFTVTLTNDGPDAATNVQVIDYLPEGLGFPNPDPSQGTVSFEEGNLIWQVGTLAAGAGATLGLRSEPGPGTYTNTAEVSASDQPDPDSVPGNNDPEEDDRAGASVMVEEITDPTPPECRLEAVLPGPPTALVIHVEDPETRIIDIQVLKRVNVALSDLPNLAPNQPQRFVEIIATKIDQSERSVLVLEVENGLGLTTTCDPVVTRLSALLPERFSLSPGYPNPFQTTTALEFSLAEDAPVRIEVYDLLGKRVATLVDEAMTAGTYRAEWDGRSDAGQVVAGGLYVVRLEAGSFVETRSVTLLR